MNTTFVPPKVPHPGALVNKKKKTFIGLPAPLGYVAGNLILILTLILFLKFILFN